jgi:hypothetical protein
MSALVKCPSCRKFISDEFRSCPKCRHAMPAAFTTAPIFDTARRCEDAPVTEEPPKPLLPEEPHNPPVEPEPYKPFFSEKPRALKRSFGSRIGTFLLCILAAIIWKGVTQYAHRIASKPPTGRTSNPMNGPIRSATAPVEQTGKSAKP